MKIKPIIFGASGMVGEGVLLTALKNENVESVLVVGRRPCGVTHPKMKEIILSDMFSISSIEDDLKGYNACFFCLGVSSVGMNEADYTRTTYDLTMNVATLLSRLNPEMTFCYVSGTGTDSTEKGRLMWARVKGKTENDLLKLPFKAAYMFRPGLMKPVDGQHNIKRIFHLLARLYPVLKFLSPSNACKLEHLGLTMISVSLKGYEKLLLGNRDITRIAMNNE